MHIIYNEEKNTTLNLLIGHCMSPHKHEVQKLFISVLVKIKDGHIRCAILNIKTISMSNIDVRKEDVLN